MSLDQNETYSPFFELGVNTPDGRVERKFSGFLYTSTTFTSRGDFRIYVTNKDTLTQPSDANSDWLDVTAGLVQGPFKWYWVSASQPVYVCRAGRTQPN